MTSIKIEAANSEKIEAALKAVNGRATSFAITDYATLGVAAAAAEDKLTALPKADRKGATATFAPAGPSANAYKYAATSTQVTMERKSSGWYLTAVRQNRVFPKQRERLTVFISQTQADEIARRSVADFVVRKETVAA